MQPLASRALLLATLVLPSSLNAHGGQWRGPGDTVPPGGGGAGGGGGGGGPMGPSGPSQPGSGGPTTRGGVPNGPGGAPGVAGSTGAGTDAGADLTLWNFWWELNKDPYLSLRAHLYENDVWTGSDDWFRGSGVARRGKDSLEPSEEQIREVIVPALLRALEGEADNDIVSGCLIALAKIGDPPSEAGVSQFEPVLRRFLADKNQEISETAAVALGILGNPSSVPTLQSLLEDSAAGRDLVGRPEVSYRTRAFAAYGMGLIGSLTGSEAERRNIVALLGRALASERTKTRDLAVSCILALGLVRLDESGSGASAEDENPVPPEHSRLAQLDFLLAILRDAEHNHLVRAHCPTALARLLAALPEPQLGLYRERVAADLMARIAARRESPEILQSSIVALGLIGTNDGADPLDRRIRATLLSVQEEVSDQQARNFALIALAKVGGRMGSTDPDTGIQEVKKALLASLADGKSSLRSWAGLACGVLARKLSDQRYSSAAIPDLQQAVRLALDQEKDPTRVGAFAVAAGIMGDSEATPALLRKLAQEKQDDARGYVALGLGLVQARAAIAPIQALVEESRYHPDLLRQAAIALGLLGDKQVVPQLVTLLAGAKSLATQASIASGLGAIGDRRSIEPLVRMLQDEELTGSARGFAAVALGIVADKEALPWNSRIGLDLNYRASTPTLTDHAFGTGILDIL